MNASRKQDEWQLHAVMEIASRVIIDTKSFQMAEMSPGTLSTHRFQLQADTETVAIINETSRNDY